MEPLKELCREMARDPDIMTFSDIANAASRGAVAGHKAQIPGGALTGAVLGVSLEASRRVVIITEKIRNQPRG